MYIYKVKQIDMETITLKRTIKGVWMERFDNYETSFKRISKKEALENIINARTKGTMFCDDNENDERFPLIFGYEN